MWNVRYLFIAAACVAMSLSSCECQKSSPPEVSRESQGSGLDAGKPPVMAEGVKPTPAAKPEVDPEEQAAAEPPPPLPEDFPKDIPVLEGAEVAQVQDLPNNAHNVIFMTDKPVAGVAEFYRKELESGGWKLTQSTMRGNHAFSAFRRGDMIANIQIAEDARYPGKRVVAIMYEKEQPLPFDEF